MNLGEVEEHVKSDEMEMYRHIKSVVPKNLLLSKSISKIYKRSANIPRRRLNMIVLHDYNVVNNGLTLMSVLHSVMPYQLCKKWYVMIEYGAIRVWKINNNKYHQPLVYTADSLIPR